MTSSRKKWGLITVGLVAALSLGAIGVAGAATSTKATPSPSASAGAAATQVPDGDCGAPGVGDHDGLGGHGRGGYGGGGDIPEALANLTDVDASDIMAQRASGTSFADIAKAEGVSTQELLAEVIRIETAELDAAVKAGTVTEAQRTEILAGMQAHLQEELTETHALPGDGDGAHGAHGAGAATGTGSASPSAGGTALTF